MEAPAAAPPPPEQPFDPRAESDPLGGLGSKLPRLPAPLCRWLRARRAGLQPWGSFVERRRFGAPHGAAELAQRLARNGERFQSNYLCVGLGLGLYCLVTSPLLLLALGLLLGGCSAVQLRGERGPPPALLGHPLTRGQQLALLGGVSLPLLWLAGAGAAVFWVLGATLVVIGSHAALWQPDPPPEGAELQMEPV